MDKFLLKLSAILCCFFCGISNLYAVGEKFIPVHINSGNPAFPFPQFLEYKEGKTLAKYNAEGVTHADMEKAMREAYEIMSHRARYNGQEVGGVKYISFNPKSLSLDERAGSFSPKCSEGDGYFLLAAAMFADQNTFNGLWMLIHDSKIPKVKKYSDGKILFEDYPFSPGMACCFTSDEGIHGEPEVGPHGEYPNEGSATDGDDDIALALLIAYKQWGEWMMQDGKPVLDYDGNPISYRQMAKDYISAYVDTFMYTSINSDGSIYKGGHTSGNIGIDGYIHGGNKGGDMTQWRSTQTDYPDITSSANIGNADAYFDYAAPAYYNEFAKWLEEDNVDHPDKSNEWRIQQYKRGEASCDWLIGQAYEQGFIPSIGKFVFNGDDTKPTFTRGLNGEDFRLAWRTILNYVWHGNPETTWDPVKHQPVAGGNTFERDMGIRFGEFLKEAPGSGNSPEGMVMMPGSYVASGRCITAGASPDGGQPYWSGPCNIIQQYTKEGGIDEQYSTNFTVGCAAPSAVAYGDLEFLGDMYREAELRWDGNNDGIAANSPERYELSTPKYFHGWFRTLGMLVNSGNFHAPANMKPAPNMKVYMSVDKTYCYVDDKVEYTVKYRNYGSKAATGVVIETTLDPNYEVVKITRGNGTITQGKNIKWTIGEVPGFKSGELEATIDSVKFIVVAKDTLNPRICLTSTISTTDANNKFEDWTSNEYPNNATYTMERNCVDILPSRTLQIKKKASRTVLNPNNIVKFTIEFENKSLGEASWLNGGRNNVRLSYANYLSGEDAYTFIQGYRLWNSAAEAYINTGNYRCSFFMYDAAAIGVYDPVTNPTGWGVFDDGQAADRKKYGLNVGDDTLKFTYKRMPYFEDSITGKRCNQRLITQFPSTVMAPSSWVFQKIATDNGGGEGQGSGFNYIHKGIGGPFFLRNGLRINAGDADHKADLKIGKKFYDDWSYEKLHVPTGAANTMQESPLYLLTPCYAIPDSVYEIDKHGRDVCDIKGVDQTYDRILVEEFDGYTWRRILGKAPRPGREAMNVTVIDTIPYELEFFAWIDSTALKDENENRIQAEYIPAPAGSTAYSGIVKWTTPVMQVGEKDKLVYACTARDFGCGTDPQPDDITYKNVAWISSATDSPDSSQVFLTTTCEEIPEYSEEQDFLFKRANKEYADVGEPVEYTVTYINNTGTHIEADCSSTNGWIPLKGTSLPKIDGGYIHLNTETSHMFGPEYSYGKDGDVYLKLDNCNKSISETWVVLRYDKKCNAAPGDPGFKGIAVRLKPFESSILGAFSCEVYDNNKKLPLGEFDDDMTAYRGDAANPLFKLTVKGDKLYLFINDDEDDWQSPTKTWKNISAVDPGYFGIYVKGKDGSSHMTQFITDLDYAFNVALADSLPSELGSITNIKLSGTGVNETGTYDAAKNYITWPTVATTVETAIAPGDSVVGTFEAEVIECGEHKYINNYAIASVYGFNKTKKVNTINCGKEEQPECDIESVLIELSDATICDGDSATIKVTSPKKTKDYKYEFFKEESSEDISLNDGTPIKSDTFVVKKAGTYSVTVYNSTIENCAVSSNSVKLLVNSLPEETLENSPALCEGEGLDLTKPSIEGYELKWYSDDKAKFPIENLKPEGTDVLDVYYYTVTDENGCVSKPHEMEVTKEAVPSAPIVETPVELATSNSKVSLDRYVTTQTEGSNVVWYESETSESPLLTPGSSMKISAEEKADLTYFVSARSTGGCESERVQIDIHISDSNKPRVNNATLCVVADTIDVTTLAETPTEGELVWCDENGTPLSDEEVAALASYTSETPAEKKFYVKTVNGPAESDVATITITTVGVATAITKDVTYCKDMTADRLSATIDASSATNSNVMADDPSKFEWYDGKVKMSEEALTPSLSVIATVPNKSKEYKVVPTYTIEEGHVCKGDTASLNVTVKVVDRPAILSSISYSLGDTLTNGKFSNLLIQNPDAIIYSDDLELLWYDEDGATALQTVPTPSVDKEAVTNEDISLKYYVSQKDGVCESDKVEVNVLISAMKTPTVKPIKFCEDDNENIPSKDIEDYVIPTESTYTLKWYDEDKQPLSSAPTIITGKKKPYAVDTVTYYVSQVNGENKESSKVPVYVHIYARPKLKAHFDTVCSKSVSLDNMWIVSNDVKETVYSKYQDANGLPLDNQTTINATGHYKAIGYFMIPNVSNYMCVSDAPEDIYVEIHNIESLKITGASSACPGGTAELDAILVGDTYNSEITYSWNHNNNSSSAASGNFVSDALNEPTTFEVTVSDGYCTETATKSVTIGQGEVKGAIVFTDHDGTTESISADGYPITFYTCGDNFSLFADLVTDDNRFDWSNGETTNAIRLTTPGKYVVNFTNKCEASQAIIIEDAAIRNNTIGKDASLCEGDKYEMALDYTCSQATTVEWKKDGADNFSNADKITIRSASTSDNGLYSYIIKNDNCEVSESYGTLTVSEAPKYTMLTKKDTTICEGTDIVIGLATLTPEIGTKLEWENNTTLTPAGKLDALATPIASTTYRFTVSQDGGCELKDSITVNVEEPVDFTMSPSETTVCMGEGKVRLSANIIKGKARKYTWTNEAGEILTTSPIYNAPADLIGESIYKVSISNGVCVPDEKAATVTVISKPTISAVTQKSYRDVEIIPSPDNESSAVKYMVDNSEAQSSEFFTNLKYGNHVAHIIDEYGCSSDFPFITNSPDIEYPTIVTPNGDGDNDVFISETVAEAYPDARITIYDRFGKKLTEIKGDESWDGTYLGKKMPTTDYWYEIWIEEIRKKYVGHFTLINE